MLWKNSFPNRRLIGFNETNGHILALGQTDFQHVFGFVTLLMQPTGESLGNGERTRPACRFGRPGQTIVSHWSPHFHARKFVGQGFRRAAENRTPAACAPPADGPPKPANAGVPGSGTALTGWPGKLLKSATVRSVPAANPTAIRAEPPVWQWYQRAREQK